MATPVWNWSKSFAQAIGMNLWYFRKILIGTGRSTLFLCFWKLRVIFYRRKSAAINWPSFRISLTQITTSREKSFVGVRVDETCRVSIFYDSFRKQNTQICRLGVFSVAYSYGKRSLPNIARYTNSINRFVRCYV
jgi:hypothetical protein